MGAASPPPAVPAGPLRLVILDCDGVLVDSERIAARVDAAVLAAPGWPLSVDEVIERFMGRTEAAVIAEVEAHFGRRLPPGWDAEYQPWYRDAFVAELAPVPGVLEALDRITTPTCVASNGAHDKIRYTLGLTGLSDCFAGRIFSAEDVARGKPAPDLFLHAAARLGAPPAACAVVEDSRPGVEAARAAGMRVFGYARVTPARHLRRPRTVLFEDMRELPRLLGEP